MVFSSTTDKNGLIQDCEFWTGLGDAGISGNATYLKQFTSSINRHFHRVVTMILESQDDWDFDDLTKTDYPVATTPMVADQRDYTFPASLKILKIKRVDITYDGNNYFMATPFDINESGYGFGPASNTTMETSVDSRFSKGSPQFDMKGNSIWIYPRASTADVAAGAKIRVEFFREITEFASTDTSTEPGIDEPWHRMLSIGASLDWAIGKRLVELKSDMASLMADYEVRLRKYYGSKDEARNYQMKSGYINYN